MNYAALLPTDTPVRTGLIGAGAFGLSFYRQSQRMPGLTIAAVCDLIPAAARRRLVQAGADPEAVQICESAAAAQRAMDRNRLPVVPDGGLLAALPLDAIVEASGSPEAGARHGWAALEQGKHLVLVTKETACTAGPALADVARRNGLVYTMADGDQPSMILDMITWARTLGLEVVCAGKAGEADYRGREADAPYWDIQAPDASGLADAVRQRSRRIPHDQRVRVPDLAELAIVINETDLGFDAPRLHGPALHYREMATALRRREEGGLLSSSPVAEVVNLLAHPHAPSMAGGVFLAVRHSAPEAGRMLAGKRHLTSADGRHLFLHRPYHLLGLETGISVLAAALRHVPTSGRAVRHRADLVCRATRDLPRGHVLALDERHCIADTRPELRAAAPPSPERCIPYYLAAERPLARNVARGQCLQYADVVLDRTSALWRLRQRQDRLRQA